MLWPKLIVNLTNPVRGGGHQIPTDCLPDHRETVLMGPATPPVTPCICTASICGSI